MKKILYGVLLAVLLSVFLFAAWNVADILLDYRQGEDFYRELDRYAVLPEQPEPVKPAKPESGPEETMPPEPEASPFPVVDFEALCRINPDVVGWIYIPDTQVNYPILQGRDNDQYLRHLLTGEYNSAGSIFLDAAVPPELTRQNSPIYGHNMKNGSMFADLMGYKGQEFYDAHPVAYLMTPDANYTLRFFSGYVASSWGDAWDTSFTPEDFQSWLTAVRKKSCFAAPVTPQTSDRVVTLSTCSYESGDARFVVHGVLEKEE